MPVRLRVALIASTVLLLAVLAAALLRSHPPSSGEAGAEARPLAALEEASGWIGGTPATVDSLAGHPVVLMAWSDTDPLSLRLLHEADAWRQAYGRFGLRVVGVHEPEFAFSADSATPARALKRLGVGLPVALDADSRVGSRLGVGDVLPVWIVVDARGRRDFTAAGDRADLVLRAAVGTLRGVAGFEPTAGGAQGPSGSLEPRPAPRRVYCGSTRVPGGPLATALPGEVQTFTAQFRFQEQGTTYTPYPVGRWTPSADGVTSARGGAADYVAIRYDGGRVDAVLGARPAGRVWVMCDDGWVPEAERGDDVRVDARGATYVDVSEPRPYGLVRGGGPHVLRLSPESPGITYHLFSFERE